MKHNKSSTDTFSANVSLNDEAKRNLLLYLKLCIGSKFVTILQFLTTFGEQLEIIL